MADDRDEAWARVQANSAAFRRDLPKLLRDHEGQWVVYVDGVAACWHDDHDLALRCAIDNYGEGFAIHQVTPTAADPVPLHKLGSAGAAVVAQEYKTLAAAAAAYLDAREAEDAAAAAYYGPAQAGLTGVDVAVAFAALDVARVAVVDARRELEKLLGRGR